MLFSETVKAIMKQNLIAFWASGDPDLIYRFLTAELLECEPTDLLLIHNLLKREVANEIDTSTGGLNALTKRFFWGMRDVLYGILTERIGEYKENKDFLPLGQILNHALTVDPKIMHEVGQMIYHDNYAAEIIESAQKSKMYRYHDEIAKHFNVIQKQTEEREENGKTDQIHENPDRHHPVAAELRMIRLIDVVTCYIDVIP